MGSSDQFADGNVEVLSRNLVRTGRARDRSVQCWLERALQFVIGAREGALACQFDSFHHVPTGQKNARLGDPLLRRVLAEANPGGHPFQRSIHRVEDVSRNRTIGSGRHAGGRITNVADAAIVTARCIQALRLFGIASGIGTELSLVSVTSALA